MAKWLDGWRRRRKILVKDVSSEGLREFQVAVDLSEVLPSLPPLQSVKENIMVTSRDGVTPIPYWVEIWDDDVQSVWIRVDVPAGGEEQFFIYYDWMDCRGALHYSGRRAQEQVLVEGLEDIPQSPSDTELHLSEISSNYLKTIIECRELHQVVGKYRGWTAFIEDPRTRCIHALQLLVNALSLAMHGFSVDVYVKSAEMLFDPNIGYFFEAWNGERWGLHTRTNEVQPDKDDSWYAVLRHVLLYWLFAEYRPVALEKWRKSLEKIINAARRNNYRFPVFFKPSTGCRHPDSPEDVFEEDVSGGYAYLMLLAYDRFKDKVYLAEALRALDYYHEKHYDELWYEAPMDVLAVVASARLGYTLYHPLKALIKTMTSRKAYGGLPILGFGKGCLTDDVYQLETTFYFFLVNALEYDQSYALTIGRLLANQLAGLKYFFSPWLPESREAKPQVYPYIPYEKISEEGYATGDHFGLKALYGVFIPWYSRWRVAGKVFVMGPIREGLIEKPVYLLYNAGKSEAGVYLGEGYYIDLIEKRYSPRRDVVRVRVPPLSVKVVYLAGEKPELKGKILVAGREVVDRRFVEFERPDLVFEHFDDFRFPKRSQWLLHGDLDYKGRPGGLCFASGNSCITSLYKVGDCVVEAYVSYKGGALSLDFRKKRPVPKPIDCYTLMVARSMHVPTLYRVIGSSYEPLGSFKKLEFKEGHHYKLTIELRGGDISVKVLDVDEGTFEILRIRDTIFSKGYLSLRGDRGNLVRWLLIRKAWPAVKPLVVVGSEERS
ncbi:MAG: hypothetical protein DRJ67_02375 [Thermoprotei archaeon]|nr:MAG: hypothetical protein DRJ67_02375 [Thermoprotei archaeon]